MQLDNSNQRSSQAPCRGVTRRSFLADTGMGFTGLALGAMLSRDTAAKADTIPTASRRIGASSGPHFQPKAKSVIWIFMCGGVSHLESFDIKPELTKYAGKSIEQTPYKDVLNKADVNIVGGNPDHFNRKVIMPVQTGYKRYGKSGLLVGDWFQHIGECADDLAVVRSLWTLDNDHGAQLTFQTGRHVREGAHPTVGSWVCYGLGTLNQNLPEYVVLGQPTGDCCGGAWTFGSSYLGPQYGGVRLNTDPKHPLSFLSSADSGITPEEQAADFSLITQIEPSSGN